MHGNVRFFEKRYSKTNKTFYAKFSFNTKFSKKCDFDYSNLFGRGFHFKSNERSEDFCIGLNDFLGVFCL